MFTDKSLTGKLNIDFVAFKISTTISLFQAPRKSGECEHENKTVGNWGGEGRRSL